MNTSSADRPGDHTQIITGRKGVMNNSTMITVYHSVHKLTPTTVSQLCLTYKNRTFTYNYTRAESNILLRYFLIGKYFTYSMRM